MLHTLLLLVVVLSFCKVGCRYTNIPICNISSLSGREKNLKLIGYCSFRKEKNGEIGFSTAILEKNSRKIQGIRGKHSIYWVVSEMLIPFEFPKYIRNDPKSTLWCPLDN